MLPAVLVSLVLVGLAVLVLLYRLGTARHAAYVEALTATGEAHGVAAGNSRCLAEATVEAVGLEALEAIATRDEIHDDPNRTLRSWGISLDEAQTERFYEQLQQCMDARQVFMDRALDDVTPEGRACLDEALSDDLLARYFMTMWLHFEDPIEVDPDLRQDFVAVAEHCSPALDG